MPRTTRTKPKYIKPKRTVVQYELAALPTLGWLTDGECGEETFYFTTADGVRGFIKCF